MPSTTILASGEGHARIDDHESSPVPLNERRGPVTMGLLWITMVASFPSVLIGFDWYKQHLSFNQVLCSLALSIVILLLYSVPICAIAVRTGLSFKLLCKKLFGSQLAKYLTFCLIVLFLGWYAVCALLMADACSDTLGGKQFLPVLAFAFSYAMAFNNFFGFKGVANFARFVGAPAVICWVIYMFLRVAPEAPALIQQSHETVPFSLAFAAVSQFIVGFAIWGNEADYWRNSNAKPWPTALALTGALIVGEIIFPLTGWLMAAKTGITETAAATTFLNHFTFGQAAIIALLFLAAQYFAANDSNLYAFAHAAESFVKLSHRKVVFIMASLAGAFAAILAATGTASALESMCALNSVLLPTATVILMAEWYCFQPAAKRDELPLASRSALVAWLIGASVGVVTSGILPFTKELNVGIPALQAWAIGLACYIPLRLYELATAKRRQELEALLEPVMEPALERAVVRAPKR